MQDRLRLTSMQLDYLRELMNIGAGNAARTLSIALRCPVNSSTPRVIICSTREVATVLGLREKSSVGVKIDLSGEISGFVYFIVPSSAEQSFIAMARPAPRRETALSDTTVMGMAAHIVVMSYMDAINTFCGVEIRRSLPKVTIGPTQTLVDEAAATAARELDVLVIGTDFAIGREQHENSERMTTYLLMFTDPDSIPVLVGSIAEATHRITGDAA